MEMQRCHGGYWLKGLILLVLGVLFLLGTLGVIDFTFAKWWPLFVILLGLKMLLHPLWCSKK